MLLYYFLQHTKNTTLPTLFSSPNASRLCYFLIYFDRNTHKKIFNTRLSEHFSIMPLLHHCNTRVPTYIVHYITQLNTAPLHYSNTTQFSSTQKQKLPILSSPNSARLRHFFKPQTLKTQHYNTSPTLLRSLQHHRTQELQACTTFLSQQCKIMSLLKTAKA